MPVTPNITGLPSPIYLRSPCDSWESRTGVWRKRSSVRRNRTRLGPLQPRNMRTPTKPKSLAVQIGDRISDWTSKVFAHPYMQIGVIVFCVTWFAIGLPTDLLTAALSILAITLTQMVLNSQYDREAEAHRRDVA